jgi:hypothetical protein
MRGRQPRWESRALEFYGRLARWKQTPESARPSLRALAHQLGTSHQLLSHYLRSWAKWQAKEYRRQADEIRARAEMENRTLTPWEQQKARVYDQEAFHWMIESALEKAMRHLERDTDTGRLNRAQVKMLRLLASRGYAKAQKILKKLSGTERSENNLPLPRSRAAKSFRFAQGVGGNSSKMLPRARVEKTVGITQE